MSKEKIREDIKAKLEEAQMFDFMAVLRQKKAATLGLTHTAYKNYKSKTGEDYSWDDEKRDFIKSAPKDEPKKVEVPEPVKITSEPKQHSLSQGHEPPENPDGKIELEGNPKIDVEFANKIFAFADAVREHKVKQDIKNGYHTKVFDQDRVIKIKYKTKWANIDIRGSGKFMVALEDINAKGVYAQKGDIVGIKAYGVPHNGYRYGNVFTGHKNLDRTYM